MELLNVFWPYASNLMFKEDDPVKRVTAGSLAPLKDRGKTVSMPRVKIIRTCSNKRPPDEHGQRGNFITTNKMRAERPSLYDLQSMH